MFEHSFRNLQRAGFREVYEKKFKNGTRMPDSRRNEALAFVSLAAGQRWPSVGRWRCAGWCS